MPRKKRSEVEAEALEALNRATDQVMGREAEPVDVLLGRVLAVESVRLADEREAEAQMGDEDDGAPDPAAEGFDLDPDGYAPPTFADVIVNAAAKRMGDMAADLAATPTRMAPAWCRAYPEAALAVYQAIASGKVRLATWKGRALVSATGETVGSVLLTPNGYGARYGRSERDDDGPEDVCRAWVEAAAVADGWMVLP